MRQRRQYLKPMNLNKDDNLKLAPRSYWNNNYNKPPDACPDFDGHFLPTPTVVMYRKVLRLYFPRIIL